MQKLKRYLGIFLTTGMLAGFFLPQHFAWAAPDNETGFDVVFETTDLYYYEDGKKVPLTVAPEVVVRFYEPGIPEEEAKSLINMFSGVIGYEEVSRTPLEYIVKVSFMPSADPGILALRMAEAITAIMQSGVAEASPVFYVDGRKAVVDGIFVLPQTPVSVRFMEKEIHRLFGDVGIRQFSQEGVAWALTPKSVFFLIDAKVPLHLLSFANLLHTARDATWVREAKPRFLFLDEVISASMRVEPSSGTVSQERTLTVTVRIFDHGISLDKRFLPEFRRGKFFPLSGSDKPPQLMFFKVLGGRSMSERKDLYGRTVVISWKFLLQAPEKEWTIASVPIAYVQDGKENDVFSSGTTFFVMPHTASGAEFKSFPSAAELKLPEMSLDGIFTAADMEFEHWLDPYVVAAFGGDYDKMKLTGIGSAATFLFLALTFAVYAGVGRNIFRRKETPSDTDVFGMIAAARAECRNTAALPVRMCYERIAAAVSAMLREIEPELPATVSWGVVKDLKGTSRLLAEVVSENERALRFIFEELDGVYAENFEESPERREKLLAAVEELASRLEPYASTGKEATDNERIADAV